MQAHPQDPDNFPFMTLGNKIDVDGGNSRVVGHGWSGSLERRTSAAPHGLLLIDSWIPSWTRSLLLMDSWTSWTASAAPHGLLDF
eukprot:1145675-Pelagomonas_calceolata.AAC.4